MNCRDYQEQLHAFLEGGVATPEGRAHAGECPECRELYAAAQRLLVGLKAQPALLPPAGLPDRVLARWLEEQRRRRILRPLSWLSAAAAVLMAGVGLWYVYQALRPDGRFEPVAEDREPQKVSPRARTPDLRAELKQAGSATLGLTSYFVPEKLPSPPPLDATAREVGRSFSTNLPPVTQTVSEGLEPVLNTVSVGFEPVTTSAGRAWNLLLRDLPPIEEPKSEPGS